MDTKTQLQVLYKEYESRKLQPRIIQGQGIVKEDLWMLQKNEQLLNQYIKVALALFKQEKKLK